MSTQLSTRSLRRHFPVNLSQSDIDALVADNSEIITQYAERYVGGANECQTLRDFVDQAALDMGGLAPQHELKRQLRTEIRRLEKLGRGGY